MIVGGHGRSCAGNRGGGGRVEPLQPRDRPPGDGRQAGAPEEHLRLALMRNLLGRARWLAGTGLSVLGWPLQVVALLLAPLVVVQPTLAAGLLVLLFLAQRMLGEHAGRHEHLTMCAIVIGVIGAALTAPDRAPTQASDLTITIVLVRWRLSSFLPYLFRLFDRPSPATVTMLGAGWASPGAGWRPSWPPMTSPRVASVWPPPGVCPPRWPPGWRWSRDERPAGPPGDPGGAGRVRRPRRSFRWCSRRCCSASASAPPRSAGSRSRLAGGADRRGGDARALPAAVGADGSSAHEPAERLGAQPSSRARRRFARARHRRGGAVEFDHQDVARPHRTLRRPPVAVSLSAPLTGVAPAVRASTSWPTDRPPRGCR